MGPSPRRFVEAFQPGEGLRQFSGCSYRFNVAADLCALLLAIRTMLAVREYQGQPVPPETVRRIVEAAHLTASSQNGQPWHFIVVEQPESAVFAPVRRMCVPVSSSRQSEAVTSRSRAPARDAMRRLRDGAGGLVDDGRRTIGEDRAVGPVTDLAIDVTSP